MSKIKYTIEIAITCEDVLIDDVGFEMSLNEVVKKLKEGYHQGVDSNEDEEYSFAIVKRENL
jgi:hypothetical protein